jgi:uncharacterized membrane protein
MKSISLLYTSILRTGPNFLEKIPVGLFFCFLLATVVFLYFLFFATCLLPIT